MDNEDKLKRINNIIMHNVEESKSDIASDRNVDDMQFCGSVMEQVLRVAVLWLCYGTSFESWL